MFPYLICFASSSFLLWFGQKIKYGQCEPFRWFVYGIALLIPVTLAGVRDWTVGIDVLFYGYPVFKDACTAQNIESGFSTAFVGWIDVGFLWLNFIVSRITHNYNIFLFVLMSITILFMFFAIYQWKDKVPIWLGMFIFYTFFFNEALNIMRQCLALSIAFCGVKYIFRRKFLYFALWALSGYLFHSSALVLLLYYPLFWYANKFASGKFTLLFSSIFLLLIIFSNQIIISFLNSMSDTLPLASKAISYLTYADSGRVPYKIFIFFCFLMILFLYKRKTILLRFPDIGRFLEITVISVVIAQLLPLVGGNFVYRFIIIAMWWLHILIPIIFYSYKRSIVTNLIVISYCLFYWYFTYILHAGGTENYSSGILSSIF